MAVTYPDDIMGDGFARALCAVWDRMKEREPALCNQPGAWELWQWTMCQQNGHSGRAVASPRAMIIAHQANGRKGRPFPTEEDHGKLFALGQRVAEEETIEV